MSRVGSPLRLFTIELKKQENMAKRTLKQGAVGPDVAAMQLLLNTIPQTLLARLIEDGVFGRKTTARVIEFQKNAKLVVDGVIGPQSWAMLDDLTKFLLPPGTTPGTLGSWRDEPFREAVLRVALGEALPVSNVSDFVPLPAVFDSNEPTALGKTPTKVPGSFRFGWPRLKQYYDEAVIGVNANFWRQTNEVKINGQVQIITNLNGVRGNNWRIPNPADPNKGGMHWCGIFATWCWIKGGVPTKWPFGGPPVGIRKRAFSMGDSPKPGDMLVQGGSLVHHSLLLPDSVGNGDFLVVNGNSDGQSVLIKPIKRKSVVAVYSLEDFFMT